MRRNSLGCEFRCFVFGARKYWLNEPENRGLSGKIQSLTFKELLMKSVVFGLALLLACPTFVSAQDSKTESKEVPAALNFKMKSIDGDEVDMSQYVGKVVLVVNVASKCGMTPQYAELEALQDKYGAKGLVVLGFPCNQFGGQEPGTEEEIKKFCSTKYDVSFPMFSKVDVKGEKQSDLFAHLSKLDLSPKGAGEVGWNFEKFLIDRTGTPVARFGSRVKPSADEVEKAIVAALGK